MREALSAALERADADDAGGPLLRATGMRLRLHLTDVGLVVTVAASDDPERCIEWRFGDDSPWEAKLDLSMDSEVANRWLQGRESIPVAIARGQVRYSGSSRCALVYLPALKLIQQHYRKVVRADYRPLAL